MGARLLKDPTTANCRIFVGHLQTDDMTKNELEDHFSKYGTIIGSLMNRGFGFVQFENEKSAQAAIQNENGQMFKGRRIDVKPAKKDGGGSNDNSKSSGNSNNNQFSPRNNSSNNNNNQFRNNSFGSSGGGGGGNQSFQQKNQSNYAANNNANQQQQQDFGLSDSNQNSESNQFEDQPKDTSTSSLLPQNQNQLNDDNQSQETDENRKIDSFNNSARELNRDSSDSFSSQQNQSNNNNNNNVSQNRQQEDGISNNQLFTSGNDDSNNNNNDNDDSINNGQQNRPNSNNSSNNNNNNDQNLNQGSNNNNNNNNSNSSRIRGHRGGKNRNKNRDNSSGNNYRDRSPLNRGGGGGGNNNDDKWDHNNKRGNNNNNNNNNNFGHRDAFNNNNNNNNNNNDMGGGMRFDDRMTPFGRSGISGGLDYPQMPLQQPDKNDCEIIVVSKILTEYAEAIEARLKKMDLTVDLLFPNEEVPLNRVLGNIASRGCLYAVVITPINMDHHSMTLNILHGLPQEHRNMAVEDALSLIARDFSNYKSGGRSVPFNIPFTADRHPDAIQVLLNMLADNHQLTVLQYDRVLKYLDIKREEQVQIELGDVKDIHTSTTLAVSNPKQAELQSRILNILNSNKPNTESTIPPIEVVTVAATTTTTTITSSSSLSSSLPLPLPLPTTTTTITSSSSLSSSSSSSSTTAVAVAETTTVSSIPAPVPPATKNWTTGTTVLTTSTTSTSGVTPSPLLNDPTVQKALDSLLQGNLLKSIGDSQNPSSSSSSSSSITATTTTSSTAAAATTTTASSTPQPLFAAYSNINRF